MNKDHDEPEGNELIEVDDLEDEDLPESGEEEIEYVEEVVHEVGCFQDDTCTCREEEDADE